MVGGEWFFTAILAPPKRVEGGGWFFTVLVPPKRVGFLVGFHWVFTGFSLQF